MSLLGCGEADLTVVPDDTQIGSDESTVIRVDISEFDEQTVTFETDLGAFWFGDDQTHTAQVTGGGVDPPFRCNGEVGTATITVTWVEEEVQQTIQIECV